MYSLKRASRPLRRTARDLFAGIAKEADLAGEILGAMDLEARRGLDELL
jgi:hypothetical protein